MKSLLTFNIWMSKTKTYAKLLKQSIYGKLQRERFVKLSALLIGMRKICQITTRRILSLRSVEWRSNFQRIRSSLSMLLWPKFWQWLSPKLILSGETGGQEILFEIKIDPILIILSGASIKVGGNCPPIFFQNRRHRRITAEHKVLNS